MTGWLSGILHIKVTPKMRKNAMDDAKLDSNMPLVAVIPMKMPS